MAENGALRFGDLVRKELIIDRLEAGTREEALTHMAGFLVEHGYCEQGYVEAILEREAAHPSALPMAGHKIAIPHADATHVLSSALLFARLIQPVEFRSMGNPDERLQVDMISMFALKEKKRIGDLLETLITVYQHEEILQAIHDARDSAEVYEILQKNVERYSTA